MAEDPAALYHRVGVAVDTLGELAAGPGGGGLARLLAGDEMVEARMRAAAAVLADRELPPDLPDLPGTGPPGHPDELLAAAVGWQRYARGRAPELHRACAADVARGMLRRWVRTRQPALRGALAGRVRRRQARITLLGIAGARCAALRAELRDAAAVVTRGGAADFPDHVARRVREVADEVAEEIDWALPGPEPAAPDLACLPASAAPVGGDRLTTLLGALFGAGTALTAGRLAGTLLPGWSGAVVVFSAVVAVALAGWVLAARRLLARRAALVRWVGEVAAALRAALEQHIALRALAADVEAPKRFTPGPGELV